MREAAVEGFHAAWELMTRLCDGPVYARDDQLVRADTGIPVAPFNGIWVVAEAPDPDRVLTAVDALDQQAPWNVQLRPGAPTALADGLAARGLAHTADIPLMAATPDSLSAPRAKVTWTQVSSYEQVGQHLDLLESVFGMPAEVTRRAFPIGVFFGPGVTTWLGHVDGELVTTGVSVQVGDTVGVFNIATPEEHRGKGYGGAATLKAAQAGFEAGARLSWLQASPLGAPVYEGLGYRTVEAWSQWMPQRLIG